LRNVLQQIQMTELLPLKPKQLFKLSCKEGLLNWILSLKNSLMQRFLKFWKLTIKCWKSQLLLLSQVSLIESSWCITKWRPRLKDGSQALYKIMNKRLSWNIIVQLFQNAGKNGTRLKKCMKFYLSTQRTINQNVL